MKWKILVLLCCLTWIGAVSGAGAAANETGKAAATKAITNDKITYNFLQEGTGGSFVNDSSGKMENKTTTDIFIQEGSSGGFVNDGSGNYTLTMNDVVPYTIFFADRPARDTGFVPMDKFLKGFNFGINNPPNAAIILLEENETSDMVIVELTYPQYNNTTQTLTYRAKQLKEYSFKSGWLQDHASEVDPAIPERFGSVELVIDGCPCVCVGSGLGCDVTYARNTCFDWHTIGCELCGGCCRPRGGCDPSARHG